MLSLEKRPALALAGALITILLFLVPRPAAAHGDEPRLEISPEALGPGMVLQVRGVGFEFEEQVNLGLAGGPNTIPLEPAVADADGIFVLIFTVPADLAEGSYRIHASTYDHEVYSPEFRVRGPAVSQDAGQDLRAEDDGLLAAMPTYAPGVSVTPMPTAVSHVEPELEETIMFLAIAILALAGIGMAARLRSRRIG